MLSGLKRVFERLSSRDTNAANTAVGGFTGYSTNVVKSEDLPEYKRARQQMFKIYGVIYDVDISALDFLRYLSSDKFICQHSEYPVIWARQQNYMAAGYLAAAERMAVSVMEGNPKNIEECCAVGLFPGAEHLIEQATVNLLQEVDC